MDRWILSLKLSIPCFSPLVSVDTRTSPYEHIAGGCFFVFFFGLVYKGSLFTDLELGQGINSIPRSLLVTGMGVVG